ncbi:hypothetical protein BUE76_09555 [Cnuella takakiae]|nr:hypothetical protein BUE76_09555 [Cnuella takakiae]
MNKLKPLGIGCVAMQQHTLLIHFQISDSLTKEWVMPNLFRHLLLLLGMLISEGMLKQVQHDNRQLHKLNYLIVSCTLLLLSS